jgi:hypothetical protein
MMEDKKGYELKVIGASLPRTGSMSTKVALEMLGFGKCYHMIENMKNDHSMKWVDLFNKKHSNFGVVLSGYSSTTDGPGCFFWEELMEENPDAKVIITTREDAEAWYKSMNETILNIMDKSRHSFLVTLTYKILPMPYKMMKLNDCIAARFNNDISKENLIKYYNDYIEDVKKKCPSEKLLIFNVKEGWEPLCKFLNVPVPLEEFPRINDTKEFNKRLTLIKLLSISVLFVGVGFITGTAYIIKKKFFK